MKLDTLFTLKIFPIEKFTPEKHKPGGSRLGSIGKFKDDPADYMLKMEGMGYANAIFGNASETEVIESFSAQLIRAIWGAQYAADIHLAQVNQFSGSYDISLFKENNQLETITIENKFCVASKWDHDGKPIPDILSELQEKRLIEMATIAKLISIVDFKLENMVHGKAEDHFYFVDCAVALNYFEETVAELFNLTYKDLNLKQEYFESYALPIIKKFINFAQLEKVLSPYTKILTEETITLIQECFENSQLKARQQLEKKSAKKANDLIYHDGKMLYFQPRVCSQSTLEKSDGISRERLRNSR